MPLPSVLSDLYINFQLLDARDEAIEDENENVEITSGSLSPLSNNSHFRGKSASSGILSPVWAASPRGMEGRGGEAS
jgi:hypothetical protein